jgi:hypothetical protein
MPEISEIRSNLKRSEKSYDDELPTPVVTDPLPYTDSSSQELIEEEARMYADNYRARKAFRWQGQERWIGRENEEMRLVNILHPHAVFQKMRDAGIDCSIEPAIFKGWGTDAATGLVALKTYTRSTARFWLHEEVILDRVGISGWVWQDGQRVPKYVTYLQYPRGPEWSVMRFDEFDVPTDEKYRGWRTALLRLMQEEIITEDEVNKAFGEPVHNAASELYFEYIAELREKRKGMR